MDKKNSTRDKKTKEFEKKLEKLKNSIIKVHKKEVLGMALLPPKKINPEELRGIPKEQIEKEKNKINILVVLDDSKSEKTPDFKLKDKTSASLIKIANSIDPNLWLEINLVSEIKESLFDGKYELLQLMVVSGIIYDPMDFLSALKISEVHKTMTIKKFEKYIVSYVAAGSLFRGEKSNDIDVYIVVDDTDVRRMTRGELKEKLRQLIQTMAFEASAITGVKKQFHVQTYILTDFWESVKDAHPVIFTFLRDGVPLYDRGVFSPWRLLLKMGRIKPSPESIEMHMNVGESLLERAKKKLLMLAGEDLYYATLNPSQAALMLHGIAPPTPKETVKLLKEIFVKKEKILEQKYVNTLDRIIKFFKDMEHGDVKNITGAEVDKLLKDVEDYLKRIKKLFNQIEKKREKESFKNINEAVNKVTKDVLRDAKIRTTNFALAMKKFCQQEGLPESLADDYKTFENAKKDFKSHKITKAELEKLKRQLRTYIRVLSQYLQRKKFLGIEQSKIRFKVGNKNGEIFLLDDVIFIGENTKTKKSIMKSKLKKDGSIGKLEKTDITDLENTLVTKELLKENNLKLKTIESLKKLYGNKLELIL
tara:strand:+ start:760 stop:2535 length:1776 start_codon:yes stop_codon:yes gene_type:complete